ncbi:MAG: tetratricopeptide repeat protein [Alphaproteobacteria bacterium]|nr:tetratricopeptide repeat protein [Alphaproteobacteria bacterium]
MTVPAYAIAPEPETAPVKAEDADYTAALARIAIDDYAAAVPLLEATLKRNPNNADAWSELGFANRKLGRWNEGQRYYENALRIDPSHLGAMAYLGELYLETDRPARARALLRQIESLCKRGCAARDALAAAMEQRGVPISN